MLLPFYPRSESAGNRDGRPPGDWRFCRRRREKAGVGLRNAHRGFHHAKHRLAPRTGVFGRKGAKTQGPWFGVSPGVYDLPRQDGWATARGGSAGGGREPPGIRQTAAGRRWLGGLLAEQGQT